jgi:hypothetical protein
MTERNVRTRLRLLFVLKLRQDYGTYSNVLSSGLYNSARFLVDMLNAADPIGRDHDKTKIEAKLVQVVDGNGIDKAIHDYKPTHVFIEALWVTPAKMAELRKLWRMVAFTIRIHSESPFLSQEGIATDWIQQYLDQNIQVAFNSERIAKTYQTLHPAAPVVYLPNYFPVNEYKHGKQSKKYVDVGCFGAIRVLKNQYNQALAALEYGRQVHKPVHFHINSAFHGCCTGPAIIRNLRALFKDRPDQSQLIEHDWKDEDDFTELLQTIDIGMQVSFSESFNIVAAQMVNANIPTVVSPEISWASSWAQADPTSVSDIASKMGRVTSSLLGGPIRTWNLAGLKDFANKAKDIWLDYLGH